MELLRKHSTLDKKSSKEAVGPITEWKIERPAIPHYENPRDSGVVAMQCAVYRCMGLEVARSTEDIAELRKRTQLEILHNKLLSRAQ